MELRKLSWPDISHTAILGYRKRHPDEIRQKREAWMAELRGEPLAPVRSRLQELQASYALTILNLYADLCEDCGGRGTFPTLQRPTDSRGRPLKRAEKVEMVPGVRRCPTCRGRGRVIPADVLMLLQAAEGDFRLAMLTAPPAHVDSTVLADLRGILRQIREETGDAWSPREQSVKPDGSLVSGDVNMVVIGGNKEEYIAKLRQLYEAPTLPAAPADPVILPPATGGNGHGNPPTSLS
jgi:hypothetical protein